MTALPMRDFTDAERAKLAAIEAAPAAAESFDATEALRRVLTLADQIARPLLSERESGEISERTQAFMDAAEMIRVASGQQC